MGTNYYWHEDACGSCGRSEELHICKSLRMFQGHFTWDTETYEPEPRLVSWSDWKAHLRSAGTILDEYGKAHDVERFIADVEAVPADMRRRQYDAVMRGDYGVREGVEPSCEWLDADGFSFYGGEFS